MRSVPFLLLLASAVAASSCASSILPDDARPESPGDSDFGTPEAAPSPIDGLVACFEAWSLGRSLFVSGAPDGGDECVEISLGWPVQRREDFARYDEPRLAHDVSLPNDWYVAFASVSPSPCTPGQRLAEDRSPVRLSGEISVTLLDILGGAPIPVDVRGELDGVTAFTLRGALPAPDPNRRAYFLGPCRPE